MLTQAPHVDYSKDNKEGEEEKEQGLAIEQYQSKLNKLELIKHFRETP